jgi:hypothetical protein
MVTKRRERTTLLVDIPEKKMSRSLSMHKVREETQYIHRTLW